MAYTGYERYQAENARTAREADTNIRRVQQNVRQDQLAKKQAMRAHKAKMEQYINDMPAGFEATHLPQKNQASLEKFLLAGKDTYANAAMEIQSYEPGSEEHRFYKDQMASVTNSFKTAKAQTDLFGTNKKDMAIDLSNGTYSKGNDIGEMGLLTSIYTDEQDMVFNENGTIGFDDGAGVITNFNDLPDYFNKDFKTGDAIQKIATTLYGKGQALTPATRLMVRNQISSMIEQGGMETLYSLATDDFFNMGGLGIPDHILKDPARRDEVEDMVVDQYMNIMDQQASSGVTYKPQSSGGRTGGKPSFSGWLKANENNTTLTADDWQNNVFGGTNLSIVDIGDGKYGIFDISDNRGYRDTASAKARNEFMKNMQFAWTGSDLSVRNLSNILNRLYANKKIS